MARAPKKAASPRNAGRQTGRTRTVAAHRASREARADGSEAAAVPAGARSSVRVYRHGLGDCILLRLKRKGKQDFKLLIDCGVVLGGDESRMTDVMENVLADAENAIDALAISHEHWDHVSGFAQAREAFDKLKVGEVWLGWIEDPKDDLAEQVKVNSARQKKRSSPLFSGSRLSAARTALC
jgi:glyoxylase-like metal-dependent hydrolase (beta-lactamase superfamily II)